MLALTTVYHFIDSARAAPTYLIMIIGTSAAFAAASSTLTVLSVDQDEVHTNFGLFVRLQLHDMYIRVSEGSARVSL